ncbi:DUF2634 domain-containing protein [Paenibacillus sp. J5C_2022]|uniref:DUF2634 domain-containing protein n=1 Tax=Paenibacillus sp. J5C2022 TaxID=2977129 RepID=UPI0021D18325|nr:DUF2634 domain-containing protein [Paenibacillus sp. J5C2022]MCU6709395.1 DUF2634 domain-containing protein [Paenibacillus sp. J5C2022]
MTLPQLAQLEFEITDEFEVSALKQSVHKTFDWDFEQGDFRLSDGKVVEVAGIDYLKIWIEKTLRTPKDSLIYVGTGYGSEHFSMIGQSFNPSFVNEEMKRMISEALTFNDAITNVDNFTFTHNGSTTTIEFQVESIYGTLNSSAQVVN